MRFGPEDLERSWERRRLGGFGLTNAGEDAGAPQVSHMNKVTSNSAI